MTMPVNEGTLVTHPLDPLTAEEIRQAAAVLRRDRGVGAMEPQWVYYEADRQRNVAETYL